MTIVNDNSRVVTKLETSLTDNARVVIYDCHMFIVQVTEYGADTWFWDSVDTFSACQLNPVVTAPLLPQDIYKIAFLSWLLLVYSVLVKDMYETQIWTYYDTVY